MLSCRRSKKPFCHMVIIEALITILFNLTVYDKWACLYSGMAHFPSQRGSWKGCSPWGTSGWAGSLRMIHFSMFVKQVLEAGPVESQNQLWQQEAKNTTVRRVPNDKLNPFQHNNMHPFYHHNFQAAFCDKFIHGKHFDVRKRLAYIFIA